MQEVQTIKFTPIRAFTSNYIWAIINTACNEVYIVDPGCAQSVAQFLNDTQLSLCGFLITHSHNDHIGGLNELLKHLRVPVYGPTCERIPQITDILTEGDTLSLWQDIEASIMHLPGHLPEHIAFLIKSELMAKPALMCGDAIFSSGCGRMFSGPASLYRASLIRITNLPHETALYCAHEYTLANIEFARHVEPNNPFLETKKASTLSQLKSKQCSLPTTVAQEINTNPFLRCHLHEIKQRVKDITGQLPNSDDDTFKALRALKDTF